jgi:hypothetical protein
VNRFMAIVDRSCETCRWWDAPQASTEGETTAGCRVPFTDASGGCELYQAVTAQAK